MLPYIKNGTCRRLSYRAAGLEVTGAPTAAGRETKEGDCGGSRISKPLLFISSPFLTPLNVTVYFDALAVLPPTPILLIEPLQLYQEINGALLPQHHL